MNELKQFAKLLLGKHYFRLAFWFLFYNAKKRPPVLIYQMGKVGSKTVEAALKSQGITTIHVHVLSAEGLERGELLKRSKIRGKDELWRNIYLGDFIRNNKNNLPWKIVTLVRDPIGRNISSFFENRDLWQSKAPDFLQGKRKIDFSDLNKEFFNTFDHERPLIWFDIELKKVFNIDVFSEPFPQEQGYKIYKQSNIEVLLLKLEKFNECFSKAICEFLQIQSIHLEPTNVSANKEYSMLYKEFLNNLKLHEDYVEAMYSARYTLHFYTKEEIQILKRKWKKRKRGFYS